MKGISPIIAAVTLMALAITLGIMVSIWMTGWVSTQRESEEFGCAGRTRYIIESPRYVQSDSDLKFRLTNKGEEGIYGFGILLYNGTVSESMAYDAPNITLSGNISESSRLGREESVYVTANLSGGLGIGTTLTEIRVKNRACEAVSAIAYYIRQV